MSQYQAQFEASPETLTSAEADVLSMKETRLSSIDMLVKKTYEEARRLLENAMPEVVETVEYIADTTQKLLDNEQTNLSMADKDQKAA